MLEPANLDTLKKIVVLNPKGGSGKTTLAFSLAGYLASTGRKVALLDMDRQGSSTHWLANRPESLPVIEALPQPGDAAGTVQVPEHIDCVVIDAPAGLDGEQLIDYTCGAHAILVPVLPSDLDIHAASRLISQLLLKAQVSRRNGRLGIVANRVKERTLAYKQLLRFLDRLSIDLVGVLRDSQNYTRAASLGRCIHEMAPSQVRRDTTQWEAITRWLESRLDQPLTKRDWLRPAKPAQRERKHKGLLITAAAATLGALAVSAWFLQADRPGPVETASEPATTTMALAATPIQPIERHVAQPPPAEVSPGEKLRERWQLTGVARTNGDTLVMLSDRSDNRTVHLSADDELDGWAVQESGSDYAVLVQGERAVRLVLNQDDAQ